MRIFIGIGLGIEQKSAILKVQDELKHIASGRFTRVDNLHLTLNFLGEVDAERLVLVIKAADEAASVTECFNIEFDRLGKFPSGRKSIIWLGVSERRELLDIYSRLSERLELYGFRREERPYSPHLTLAREARLEKPLESLELSAISGTLSQHISEITVYESRSKGGLLEYVPLHVSKFI